MKRLLPLLLSLSLLALAPAGVNAAPNLAETGELSGPPGQMTKGPRGTAWVLFDGAGDENLARVKPSGKVKEYEVPDLVGAVDITLGPGGNLWATRTGAVVKVPTDDPENANDFDINGLDGGGQGITFGPQQKLWAAGGDQIVSFEANDPAGYEADTINGMSARGVDDADHRIWIADFGGQRIVRYSPNGGVKNYNVGGGPQQVTDGPNGQIAYTNPGDDPQTVGRIGKTGGAKTTNDPGADPFGIEFADDGNWWIAQFNKPGKLGRLSQSGNLKQFDGLPNNAKTRYLVESDDALFVGVENRDEVAIIKGF